MTDKSKEHIPALPSAAKEKGTLKPPVSPGLAKLIGAKSRPKVEDILEDSEVAETETPRELSIEQEAEFLSVLEERFSKKPKHYNRPEGISFADILRALRANPTFMYSLAQMQNTGGVPDIIAVEPDAYVFGDCSAESPNRRDLTYDQAEKMAEEFGVELMTEDVYRQMQKNVRFDFSIDSDSWLKTPKEVRNSIRNQHTAFFAMRSSDVVMIFESNAQVHIPARGWRGVLRVPKV